MATGRDLASCCRERLPRPVVRGLWAQAEAVAVATDLTEIAGGAVALKLLFGVPLPIGGVLTAVVAFALLAAERRRPPDDRRERRRSRRTAERWTRRLQPHGDGLR
nr:divalent metal cation transporter [Modestobacter sp. DSM 44400]